MKLKFQTVSPSETFVSSEETFVSPVETLVSRLETKISTADTFVSDIETSDRANKDHPSTGSPNRVADEARLMRTFMNCPT